MLDHFMIPFTAKSLLQAYLGIDERQIFPIDGKTRWMWVARSKTESYYYTLEYSRGSKILKETLKEILRNSSL